MKREEAESAKLYEDFIESFKAEDERKAGQTAFIKGETIIQEATGTVIICKNDDEPKIVELKKDVLEKRCTNVEKIMQENFKTTTQASSKPNIIRKAGHYVPSFIPPTMAAAMKAEEFKAPISIEIYSSCVLYDYRKPDKAKPRNIDIMLESIKREQEAREVQTKPRKTAFDIVLTTIAQESLVAPEIDPTTTNLYVGNLAPDIDEDILRREFGRFGAIASVKIMWPRDEEQLKRGSNIGFVAFMDRDAATKCLNQLNGEKLHGLELRIGWGKSVPLPTVNAVQPLPIQIESILQLPQPTLILPQSGKAQIAAKMESFPDDIKIVPPQDTHIRYIIDTLASFVLRDGCAFEQLIMERESENVMYKFLYDLESSEHAYYRWKLFSLAQGDSMRSWRLEPFYMIDGGARWIPPNMCIADGSQLTAAQAGGEAVRQKTLSEMERGRFENMLRNLKIERTNICEAMVFSLNNADAAEEIVEILCESLSLPETPIPLKIARLFLVSDILYNCTAPVRNVTLYRTHFQERLPDIFENFRDLYLALSNNKNIQEFLKKYVLRVLRVWRNWFVFSNDYLNGLQATFLKQQDAGMKPEEAEAEAEGDKTLESLSADEIERKCRLSGLSLKGGKERQIARLNHLEEYLNGSNTNTVVAALPPKEDESSEDVLMEHEQRMIEKGRGMQATSNWTTVDKEEEEKERQLLEPVSTWLKKDLEKNKNDSSEKIFSDAGSTPIAQPGLPTRDFDEVSSRSPSQYNMPVKRTESSKIQSKRADRRKETKSDIEETNAKEDRRRKRARDIEIQLMIYREDLENEGVQKGDIDKLVSEKRQKLMNDVEKFKSKEEIRDQHKSRPISKSNRSEINKKRSTRDIRQSVQSRSHRSERHETYHRERGERDYRAAYRGERKLGSYSRRSRSPHRK